MIFKSGDRTEGPRVMFGGLFCDGGSAGGMIQSGGGFRLHEDEHLTCGGAESHFGDPTDGGLTGEDSD